MVAKRKKTKVGKDRLDKFYHFAKDQGYRSRAAFKLIQLAKKYDFLSKARTCLDLCGAPGSWTQVAVKHMPLGSRVVVVDLAPIKPIRGVVTMQADITTNRCRKMLAKHFNGDKIEVVLNDGAPNMGAAWTKDAYGQAELTLHACKLACDVLKPNGTFVTKVFRSGDYNSLLWVFQQLFKKVEATKPQASRAVSAEIFVVCQGYLAPEQLDARFFDPKWVFMETAGADGNDKDGKDAVKTLAEHFKFVGKKQAKRVVGAGLLEDGVQATSAKDFIESKAPANVLIKSHKIIFPQPECDDILKNKLTTPEIKELCTDLRILGKGDMTGLMKWRIKYLKSISDSTEQVIEGAEVEEDDAVDDREMTKEEKAAREDEELQELLAKGIAQERRERKRRHEIDKKQEWRKKMSMGTFQAGIDDADPEIFRASNARARDAIETAGQECLDSDDAASSSGIESDEDGFQHMSRLQQLEVEMENTANVDSEMKSRQKLAREKSAKKETRRERKSREWANEMNHETEIINDRAREEWAALHGTLSESEDEEEEQTVAEMKEEVKADRFFSQSLFKDFMPVDEDEAIINPLKPALDSDSGSDNEEEEEGDIEEMGDDDLPHLPLTDKQRRKNVRRKEKERAVRDKQRKIERGELDPDSDGEFETVPPEEAADLAIATEFKPEDPKDLAQTLAIGHMMINKKSRMDTIDNGYNRFAWNDPEGLPKWFTDEEARHNKAEMPVSAELMEQYREKLREINARPVRKVAEAQARRKRRLDLRMERIRKQAQILSDSQEISAISKLRSVKKLISEAKRKDKRTVVLSAPRANAASAKVSKGKAPKGAKVKMVDKRMKNDNRHEKWAVKKKMKKTGKGAKPIQRIKKGGTGVHAKKKKAKRSGKKK